MYRIRALGAALALCLVAARAAAEDQVAGTRVERRVFVKKGRFFASGGVGWFARGDYYNNPGIAASLTYYPIESGGIELRAAGFFSSLDAGAQEIFSHYNSTPDAQQPVALAMIGWRQSFAYGKLVIANAPGSIVHFDLQATAHVGSVMTTQAANPGASVGVAALVRVSTFVVQLDVPFVISREITQERSVAMGLLPMLSIGIPL